MNKVVAALLLLAPLPAAANDGFYVGGHVGYLFGTGTATLGDPTGIASAGGSSAVGQLFGGVQAGYQTVLPSRWMLGVELDLSFIDARESAQVLSYRTTAGGYADEQLEYLGGLRGRLGYALGAWTPFVTGGLAFASTRWSNTSLTTGNEDATPGQWRLGWTVGAGLDYAVDKRWTARVEYLYTNLGPTGFTFGAPARYDTQYDLHRVRFALNYHFGDGGGANEEEKADDRGFGSWEIHGQ